MWYSFSDNAILLFVEIKLHIITLPQKWTFLETIFLLNAPKLLKQFLVYHITAPKLKLVNKDLFSEWLKNP